MTSRPVTIDRELLEEAVFALDDVSRMTGLKLRVMKRAMKIDS